MPPAAYSTDAVTLPPARSPANTPPAHSSLIDVDGYEVLGELGRGGMGVVYKARQCGLNRVVALKMILAGDFAGEAELTRFRLEAEAVARLQHPNIVQVFEIGESHGHPFFSLEFVDGGTLASRLSHQPQPARRAAELVAILARAMHAAHLRGIVHRDLKPANVLLAADSTPKITDFGLAKRLDVETALTQSNAILGTPSYMAPEQAEAKTRTIGPPADIYALGAILYEMLTGRPPFLAETPLDTILQVVADEPAPPSRIQSKVPQDLEAICMKCLEKEPRHRYATAQALAEDLERFLAGSPTEAGRHRTLSWLRRHAGHMAAVSVWLLAPVAVLTIFLAEPQLTLLLPILFAGLLRAGLWLWRRSAVRSLDILRGHRGKVYSVAFTPDGKRLASASADRTVRLWELATSSAWATLSGHRRKVYAAAFNPDGRVLASAGADRTVRLWDPVTGTVQMSLPQMGGRIYALAFSPNGGTLAVGCANGTAGLWDANAGRFGTMLQRGKRRAPAVYALAFSPDGRRLCAGHADGTATVWDLGSNTEPTVLREKGGRRFFLFTDHSPAIAFSPDGKLLATGRTQNGRKPVRLWNAVTGQLLGSLEDRDWGSILREILSMFGSPPWGYRTVYSLAFSPDSKLLAAAHGRLVKVWAVDTGELRHQFAGHSRKVVAVAFAPDGQTLASGSADRTIRLWDPASPWRPKQLSWWQKLVFRRDPAAGASGRPR